MTDKRIRDFASADQAYVRALVLAGLADHWGTLDLSRNPDLDDIAGWYGPMSGHTIVAEHDGSIVGTGTMHQVDDQTGVLVRMSVSRDCRGQGIGRALVAALVETARKRGYRRLICETTDTWQDAINLYLKSGFQIVDQREGDYHFELTL